MNIYTIAFEIIKTNSRKGAIDLELIIKIIMGLIAFSILILAVSIAARKLGSYGSDFVPLTIKNVFS